MSRLRVTETGDIRWYEHDGVRAMSVTSILSAGFPKGALLPWSVKMCAERAIEQYPKLRTYLAEDMAKTAQGWLTEAASDYANAAAERGTRIHDTVEAHIKGTRPPTPADRGETLAAEGVLKFLNSPGVTVMHSEEALFDTSAAAVPYAGRADLVLGVSDEGLLERLGRDSTQEPAIVMADIKCGRSVWSSAAVQMSAYAAANTLLLDNGNRPTPNLHYDFGLVLHAGVRGCRVLPVHWGDDVTASDLFQAFRAAALLTKLEARDWQQASPIGKSIGTWSAS